ncbi:MULTISPECIES: Na+/H+ antiporter subunit E [Salinicoccus]|uniref:Monovalent cation/H+ antiporter subunit E n=1 Tax=Salinicoccus sediminis TaxID=1432562 RepID=A0A0M2SH84_9STAP|nr:MULTISPECIES: Na+/H+ antiporter subunit E [Salinicoccus]KKK34079.1 monovalent cation/H+ antiporter subunit E [Salinicoccus sediminis]
MPLQILINLLLAVLWMFMGSEFSVASFTTGYIMGLAAVFLLRRFLPGSFYLRRVWRIVRLFFIFIIEMVKANIDVVKIVLSPKIDVHPGFYAYPCDLEEDWEVVLLSSLITLTPGTVVVAISDDHSTIYIHGVDMKSAEEEIQNIKSAFENEIKEVAKP